MSSHKFYNLILSIILLPNFCFTQDTLKLDFETKNIQFGNIDKIKPGQFYILEIDNINMNLFNVSLSKKDSLIPISVPFPTFELLGFESLEKLISNINSSTISTEGNNVKNLLAEIQILSHKKATVENELEYFLTTKGIVLDQPLYNIDINNLISTDIFSPFVEKSDFDNKLSEISELRAALEFKSAQLDTSRQQLNELDKKIYALDNLAIANKNIELVLLSVKPYFDNINSAVSRLNLHAISYLESLYSKPINSIIGPRSELVLQESYIELNRLKEILKQKKNSVLDIEKEYNKSKNKLDDLNNIDTLIKNRESEFKKNIKSAIKDIDKEIAKISQDKLFEYISSIIHMENNKNRSYTSLPLQHNSDISKLEINITPKKPEFGQSYKAEYQFPKIRSIVGVGGAFYYGFGFSNEIFSIQETPTSDTTSVFNIVKEKEQQGEFGIATFLHIVHRLNICGFEDLGINIVFGPAFSFSDRPQLRLAIGGGLSYGASRNMLSLNALLMHGYTQVKSNVFEEGDTYSLKPDQITVSTLSRSFGLSLGYIYRF